MKLSKPQKRALLKLYEAHLPPLSGCRILWTPPGVSSASLRALASQGLVQQDTWWFVTVKGLALAKELEKQCSGAE